MSLPYAHLLNHLVQRRPNPSPPCVESENLLKYLPKFRFVSRVQDDGITIWKPDDSVVNSWIKAEGAATNQYCDPKNTKTFAYPTSGWRKQGKKGETSTSQEPQTSQPHLDDPFTQMQTMFATWSTGFDDRFNT